MNRPAPSSTGGSARAASRVAETAATRPPDADEEPEGREQDAPVHAAGDGRRAPPAVAGQPSVAVQATAPSPNSGTVHVGSHDDGDPVPPATGSVVHVSSMNSPLGISTRTWTAPTSLGTATVAV